MDPNELTDEIKEQASECKSERELDALSEEDSKEEGTSAELPLDDLGSAAGGQVVYMCLAPEDEEQSQMP